nr:helix-turn-helix domain-containing protein [Auraticoccus cholistanensis]
MTPEEEVERLRTVSLEQVRFDLTKVLARSSGRRHERVAAMLAAPAEARERIAEAWSAVWEVALAPYWEQSRRLMTADIALRTQQLAARGLGEVVATLADGVHWRGDAIEVDMRFHSEVVDCAGSGVVLVPSVMSRRCSVLTEKHVQATLFYPVRGVSESWTEPRAPRREALARLLGAGRAEVLLSLDAPRSTSEVAAACGLGAPTASHHLAVLRDARLVDSSRDGGRVLHARTPLGDTLAG